MLRLLRIALMVFTVLVLIISVGLLHFGLTVGIPAASHPPAPGLYVGYTLGSNSLQQDQSSVERQVRVILAKQEINGIVWIAPNKSHESTGWFVGIDVSPVVDHARAEEIGNKISEGMSREFPESRRVSSAWKGPALAHSQRFMLRFLQIFFPGLCILAAVAFWLVFRWRPGSPRGHEEQRAE